MNIPYCTGSVTGLPAIGLVIMFMLIGYYLIKLSPDYYIKACGFFILVGVFIAVTHIEPAKYLLPQLGLEYHEPIVKKGISCSKVKFVVENPQ